MGKILENTHKTIATNAFIQKHPELHHYTSRAGLTGIIESRTLWATLYKDLNDATEIEHFKKPLIQRVVGEFDVRLREAQKSSLKVRQRIKRIGGLQQASLYLSNGLIDAYYQATFGDASNLSSPPFIASFCTHALSPYEQLNGLLSQWRGYAEGGGFCLVFDTQKIAGLLDLEIKQYEYVFMNLEEVIYSSPLGFEVLFSRLKPQIDMLIVQVIDRTDDISFEQSLSPFVEGATLYKHQAFREESEVRIVAIPASAKVRATLRRMHAEMLPIKRVEKNENHGKITSHISLFKNSDVELPINRIIVGPAKNQPANVTFARELVNANIPIKASETPLIE